MNTNFKDMTLLEKITFMITCISAVPVMAACVKPDLFPVDITCPAIALVSVLEAVSYWKQKRKWAYLLIAAAVISATVFLLELFAL